MASTVDLDRMKAISIRRPLDYAERIPLERFPFSAVTPSNSLIKMSLMIHGHWNLKEQVVAADRSTNMQLLR